MKTSHKSRTKFFYLLLIFTVFCHVSLFASQIQVSLTTGSPYLFAHKKQVVPVRIGLTGLNLPSRSRTPVNISIVLDRSGSMAGEKLERAKEAAIMAINLLSSEDIVSVVAYDDTVQVIVPATKVWDRERINQNIRYIYAGNSTALFAGVSRGVEEVRKFYDSNRINRVILLSDGMANVGPSSSYELGDLGASLRREGISVTTLGLGLGYNEDLMVELAGKSDGNHGFIENAFDLGRIFNNEFGDILSVVAQDIGVTINCREGVRPIRILGRDGDIHGQSVITSLNQIYSNQEKFILLEVEVPPHPAGHSLKLLDVEVSYSDLVSKTISKLSQSLGVVFTESEIDVERNLDKKTMVDYVKQNNIIEEKKALILRDKGRKEEAQAVLRQSAAKLDQMADSLQSDDLKSYSAKTKSSAAEMDSVSWEKQRKQMRKDEYKELNQQAW